MLIKSQHFQMRLTVAEKKALAELARREGLTASAYLTRYIHRQAKRGSIKL